MSRLVLIGEGHGDVSALPILVRKLLSEEGQQPVLFVDREVVRFPASRVFRRRREAEKGDCAEWLKAVTVGARRGETGAILAVYDGDLPSFPLGSGDPFCAGKAAKTLAAMAKGVGAGTLFSLSVVFACAEYETWLIAGLESLKGRRTPDGRAIIPQTAALPSGEAESHGKRWLEAQCPDYRPTRDQAPLTEMLDLPIVRSRKLRSFRRLEHALEHLVDAARTGSHVSTPE